MLRAVRIAIPALERVGAQVVGAEARILGRRDMETIDVRL